MIVWPGQGGDLARFFGWLTVTHTQRWHAHRKPPGENGS
jgi:putative transposase